MLLFFVTRRLLFDTLIFAEWPSGFGYVCVCLGLEPFGSGSVFWFWFGAFGLVEATGDMFLLRIKMVLAHLAGCCSPKHQGNIGGKEAVRLEPLSLDKSLSLRCWRFRQVPRSFAKVQGFNDFNYIFLGGQLSCFKLKRRWRFMPISWQVAELSCSVHDPKETWDDWGWLPNSSRFVSE